MKKINIAILIIIIIIVILLLIPVLSKYSDLPTIKYIFSLYKKQSLIYNPDQYKNIPKIIHQTWKTTELPDNFKKWSKTIKDLYPSWEYKLWTDEDNRNFIKDNYPWYLYIYDSYDKNIKRVDAVRYFYLYHYGGMYIDLDFEALKSIDKIIQNKQIILGKLNNTNCNDCLPNAIMISVPKHPFWLYCIYLMSKRFNFARPEYDTGPILLKNAYDSYTKKNDIFIAPSEYFYPIDWTKKNWKKNNLKNPHISFPNSYFITYWTHTWN